MATESQSKPLCSSCQRIISWTKSSERQEEEDIVFPFQPSFEALRTSASSCTLCEYLLNDVLKGKPLHGGHAGFEEQEPVLYKAHVTAERDLRRGVFSIRWREEPLYPSPHLGNTDCYYISYPENTSTRMAWQQSDLTFDSRLRRVSEWISNCLQHHTRCISAVSTLPKRLLDVRMADTLQEVKLIESEALGGEPIRYATLSHCWGPPTSGPPLKTTSSNLSQHFQGIALSTLTLNFRDAVSICCKLGMGYIWIDSLCIIQDDKADWEIEASKMADIYRGGHLNIAAAAAHDAHGGIIGKSSMRDPVARFKLIEYLESTAVGDLHELPETFLIQRGFGLEDYLKLKTTAYPYFGRGWVLQEQVLPPRTVIFPNGQMFWQCFERFGSEDDTLWREEFRAVANACVDQYAFDLSSPLAASKTWKMWIESYATRKFTYISDVAPAISGPIRFFGEKMGYTPMLGLWKETLGHDLAWSVAYSKDDKPPSQSFQEGNFPSWSWLSVLERGDRAVHLQLSGPLIVALSSIRIQCWEEEWASLAYTSKLTKSKLVISTFTQDAIVTMGSDGGREGAAYRLNASGTPGWTTHCRVNYLSPAGSKINVKLVHVFQTSTNFSANETRFFDYFLIVKSKHGDSGPFYRIGEGHVSTIWKEEFTPGKHYPLKFDESQRETIELI